MEKVNVFKSISSLQTHTQPYLPLPVRSIDEDQTLGERRVRQQDLIQLVVHGLPQDLHTQRQTEYINPSCSDAFTLQMTHHRHIHNSFLSCGCVRLYQDSCVLFTLGKAAATGNTEQKAAGLLKCKSHCGNTNLFLRAELRWCYGLC